MKKALLILLAVCALGLTGCRKDDHNYYIKYRVYYINDGHYYPLSATITNYNGQQISWTSSSVGRDFECVIGPVQTGFNAELTSSGGRLEIYACRDAEPWVLRVSGGGTISYTLDF